MAYKFQEFFLMLDKDLDKIGVRSYGISVTTLEEVFLAVGHGDGYGSSLRLPQANLRMAKKKFLQVDDDYSISDPKNYISPAKAFFSHIGA